MRSHRSQVDADCTHRHRWTTPSALCPWHLATRELRCRSAPFQSQPFCVWPQTCSVDRSPSYQGWQDACPSDSRDEAGSVPIRRYPKGLLVATAVPPRRRQPAWCWRQRRAHPPDQRRPRSASADRHPMLRGHRSRRARDAFGLPRRRPQLRVGGIAPSRASAREDRQPREPSVASRHATDPPPCCVGWYRHRAGVKPTCNTEPMQFKQRPLPVRDFKSPQRDNASFCYFMPVSPVDPDACAAARNHPLPAPHLNTTSGHNRCARPPHPATTARRPPTH